MRNIDKLPLQVVMASDENYLHLVAVVLTSLFVTNNSEKIHVHLLSNSISEAKLYEVRLLVESYGGMLNVYPINNLNERLSVKVPQTIALTSYARLFIPSILPGNLDKVLYIDCDIIFNGDIRNLFDIDLKEALVGGVLDPLISCTYKKEIKIPVSEPYINAGVLLIPLNQWRSERMEQKFVDYLVTNRGKVHHHDQGIINALCAGRKKVLPPQFNVMSNCLCYPWKSLGQINRPFYQESEYSYAIKNPSILHFTGAILGRPWVEGCTHPHKEKYVEYKSKTIYRNMPLKAAKVSIIDKVGRWLYRNLPFRVYQIYMQTVYGMSYIKHRL